MLYIKLTGMLNETLVRLPRSTTELPAALQNGYFSQNVCLLQVIVHVMEHLNSHLCHASNCGLEHLQHIKLC